MKSEAEGVQVGMSQQNWGKCGDPRPQDAAERASVKHQLVVFSINDGACGSFWKDWDNIDPGPVLRPEPPGRFPAHLLNTSNFF